MSITINGNGTVTGLSAGGLPAGSVTSATLADVIDPSATTGVYPVIEPLPFIVIDIILLSS